MSIWPYEKQILIHRRNQKFLLGWGQNGKSCDVSLVTFFYDVITMTS